MASKFRQYIEDLIYGHESIPEAEYTVYQANGEPEQEQSEDRDWLDEEVEKQQSQQMPDAAYEVSERDEPAPEQVPEQVPATGEITPGQSDVEHDGLQQDGSMDRDTMSDGLDQGGGMDEIEM